MKRRINSTGRKRINREDIKISMLEVAPGKPLRANAELELEDYGFPPDAHVAIEAYHRASGQRFNCNTVGSLSIPSTLVLDEVDHSGTVLFRVKVVNNEEPLGQLLGSAERIQPKSELDNEGKKSLFPVLHRDIGAEIWKVELAPDHGPNLILNNRLPDFRHRLQYDPILQGLMLPAALRIVLEVLVKDSDGIIDDEEDWKTDWKEFCKSGLGIHEGPPGLGSEEEEKAEWIDSVVKKFSAKHRFLKNIQNLQN